MRFWGGVNDFVFAIFFSSLPKSAAGQGVADAVSHVSKRKADDGHEQVYGGGVAELSAFDTHSVYIGADNVGSLIGGSVVEKKDHVGVAAENRADAHNELDGDDALDAGKRDVPDLTHVVCAVDAGGFVKRGIDGGKRGEIQNACEAEFLPDGRYGVNGREGVGLGDEFARLAAECGEKVVDNAVYVKEGNGHTCNNNA